MTRREILLTVAVVLALALAWSINDRLSPEVREAVQVADARRDSIQAFLTRERGRDTVVVIQRERARNAVAAADDFKRQADSVVQTLPTVVLPPECEPVLLALRLRTLEADSLRSATVALDSALTVRSAQYQDAVAELLAADRDIGKLRGVLSKQEQCRIGWGPLSVKCPSRTVVGVVGLAAGVVGGVLVSR